MESRIWMHGCVSTRVDFHDIWCKSSELARLVDLMWASSRNSMGIFTNLKALRFDIRVVKKMSDLWEILMIWMPASCHWQRRCQGVCSSRCWRVVASWDSDWQQHQATVRTVRSQSLWGTKVDLQEIQTFSNFHVFSHFFSDLLALGQCSRGQAPCPVPSTASAVGLLVYRTERCSWAEAAELRRGDQLVKVSGVDAKLLTLGIGTALVAKTTVIGPWSFPWGSQESWKIPWKWMITRGYPLFWQTSTLLTLVANNGDFHGYDSYWLWMVSDDY